MAPARRLNALQLERAAKRKGMHHDGGGLYLCSDGKAQCSWLFRYMIDKTPRSMGLGPYPVVTLADARGKADAARRVLKVDGKDPIKRDRERAKAQLEAAKAITFRQAATEYIDSHRHGWRNAKHEKLWGNTLATYAYPRFGKLPVAVIDTALVLKAVRPIWTTKPETAGRVRQRIESVLDWAKASGYREGENPARWRAHLDKLLPPQTKVRRVAHHAALPFAELPTFMIDLRGQTGTSALALEFAILTAARTGEALGARWSELDLEEKTWTVPAARMKMDREHRVPLAQRAVDLLSAIKPPSPDGDAFVFPGGKPKRPLSNMAFLMLLRRMKRDDITAHGFRATFKTWAAERTTFQNQIIETSLAHVVGGKVEQAYMRGDLFDKRRELMTAWGDYCEG